MENNNETKDGQELKPDVSNYNPDVYNKPSVTVDICILRYINKTIEVLLIKRGREPFKDTWAIPGGFVNIPDTKSTVGQETLEEAAARELKEETGLENIYIEQLKTYGDPNRDPRMRIITTVYFALVNEELLNNQTIKAGDDAKEVGWFPLRNYGVNVAFDHDVILKDLYTRLQGKITYAPLAFKLLPEKFTWSALKGIYEYLLERSLIEPNFRRKINSSYVVEELKDEVKKATAGRPARLLRYIKTIENNF